MDGINKRETLFGGVVDEFGDIRKESNQFTPIFFQLSQLD
jgi:hypothetical protein